MSHIPGHDGIAEILSSGQFPGTVVRQTVRSALLRDRSGGEVRVIYGGGIDAIEVERDMIRLAEEDGVNLAEAEMKEMVPEEGQGVGKSGSRFRDLKKRKRRATRDISVGPVPEA